jgi:nitrite reductase/ring-hydroxylating ferredoxin subunit
VVIARRGVECFAYLNNCPHVGTSLNMFKDDFMSIEKDSPSGCGAHLRCSTHFALFDVADGFCIAGPCSGQSLVSVGLEVEGDLVRIRNPSPKPEA